MKEITSESDNKAKKFDVKVYLENFEKDIKEAELREFKWKKDQIQRAKKFEEDQQRIQERIKEKAESEEIFYVQKKQDAYNKHLEKIKNKSNLIKEDMVKLNELKEEWKTSQVEDKQYLFKILEDNFKKKETEEKEEHRIKMVEELAKKKILFKPVDKCELEDFKKKFEEEKKKKNYEKDKERLLKKEELIKRNSELPKGDTKVYEKIVEEEKKIRENVAKDKLDKVYNAMKIKQFAKVVLKNMVPKIDEEKKQEIAERIKKEAQIRPEKLTKSKHERIILKKPDLDNPNKKYTWERKLHARSLSKTSEEKESSFMRERELKDNENSNRKLKRDPLAKNPDYLTMIREEKIKRSIDNKSKIDKSFEIFYLFI